MELAVIDLETTGTSPESDRIVEIAVVRVRGGEVVQAWSSLVRADVGVGASERVHGIGDAMLAAAPSIATVAERVRSLVERATLVAHRAAFDVAFLDHAARRGELDPMPRDVVDTAAVAERVLGDASLLTLARRIGGRLPTHRALPDALAALDVLDACIETLGPIEQSELVALSSPAASMRREIETLARTALTRREPLGVLYRPASGRMHEDTLDVESVTPPYLVGTLGSKRGRRTLRGDRFVRAWLGPRPQMRFF